MKKQNKTIIFVLLIALAIGVFMFATQQTAVTSNTFVNPDWARLECAPTDAYEGQLIKYADQQSSYTCDAYTEECRIKIDLTTSSFRCNSIDVFLDNSKISWTNGQYIIFKVGQTISLKDPFCIGSTDFPYAKVTMEWKPWKLYRFVGGAKWIVNTANCDVSSSLNANIRAEDYPGSKLYRQGGEGTKWINYVNAWNYGPATNVFTYQGQEVYCNAAKLYTIVKLQMANNALVKLDPTVSDTLPNGDVISGMGNLIKSVDCCPNEPNCGDDFVFKQTTPSCFTDAQCTNAGGPIPQTTTTYVKFTCVNSKCLQSTPITVQCTTNSQCPAGTICDLSTTNYGNCIKQISEYCGDGVCQSFNGETSLNCAKDCTGSSECSAWYQKSYTVNSYKSFLGIQYGAPTQTQECGNSSLLYIVIAAVIILLITLMYFAFKPRGKRR